jgi:hypothetical protein
MKEHDDGRRIARGARGVEPIEVNEVTIGRVDALSPVGDSGTTP